MEAYRVYEREYEGSAKYFQSEDAAHSHAMHMVMQKLDGCEDKNVEVTHHYEYGEKTYYRFTERMDFVAVEKIAIL